MQNTAIIFDYCILISVSYLYVQSNVSKVAIIIH